VIENRSQERHAFHVHQLNFLVGSAVPSRLGGNRGLLATQLIPAWEVSPVTQADVRWIFRHPRIVGIVPFMPYQQPPLMGE